VVSLELLLGDDDAMSQPAEPSFPPEAVEPVVVKSADSALAIMDLVAARGSVRFNELVAAMGLPRSSMHGLLHTLVSRGWLDLDEDSRRYAVGLRAWQVGQRYAGHGALTNIATPVMDRLSRELGETVQLARLDGIENVYIAMSEAPQPMRLVTTVGMRLHAHATGIGKALLAQLPPEEAAERLRAVTLPRFTEHTIVDPDLLDEALAQVRRDGYARDEEEVIIGCRCVAVPLLDDGNGLVTALSVTAPKFRCGPDWPAAPLAALRSAAEEIRARLGV
jgi:DNA-binding IclR family transcriptional regulator